MGSGTSSNISTMYNSMKNFSTDNYLNTDYAKAARGLKENELDLLSAINSLSIGTPYWLQETNHYEHRASVSGTSYTGYTWYHNFGSGTGWWCNQIEGEDDPITIWSNSSLTDIYRVDVVNASGSLMTDGTYTNRGSWGGNNVPWVLMTRGQISGAGYSASPTGSTIIRSEDYDSPRYWYSTSSTQTVYGKANATYGFRVVVELNEGILTTNEKNTEYLGNTCWGISK